MRVGGHVYGSPVWRVFGKDSDTEPHIKEVRDQGGRKHNHVYAGHCGLRGSEAGVGGGVGVLVSLGICHGEFKEEPAKSSGGGLG